MLLQLVATNTEHLYIKIQKLHCTFEMFAPLGSCMYIFLFKVSMTASSQNKAQGRQHFADVAAHAV